MASPGRPLETGLTIQWCEVPTIRRKNVASQYVWQISYAFTYRQYATWQECMDFLQAHYGGFIRHSREAAHRWDQ